MAYQKETEHSHETVPFTAEDGEKRGPFVARAVTLGKRRFIGKTPWAWKPSD
jgi:hypothetical protein